MGVCLLFQHVEEAHRVDSLASVARSTAHALQEQHQAVAYGQMSVQVTVLVTCTILCTACVC